MGKKEQVPALAIFLQEVFFVGVVGDGSRGAGSVRSPIAMGDD